MVNSLTKELIKLSTKLNPISVGTKFFPTNSVETEYVELFNYTQTILFELEKAEITSESIWRTAISGNCSNIWKNRELGASDVSSCKAVDHE